MRKKIYYFVLNIILVSCLMFMTGCSIIPSISLNEEETSMVAEYSAGLLLKYDKGHKMGLQRVDDMDFAVLNLTPTPTPLPTPVPEEPIVEVVSEDKSALVDDKGEKSNPDTELSTVPLNEVFGLLGAELSFAGGELCKEYPGSGEDLTFSMNATLGSNLMILHFDLYNPGEADLECITNLDGFKVRAVVNETDRYRAEISLLQNDIINYKNSLAPGEHDDVVVVFEVPEDTQINSLLFKLVRGKEQYNYKLY